jgi:hypothetical protein
LFKAASQPDAERANPPNGKNHLLS